MKLTTPKGIAQYPWLNTPDTKFSEHGDYKVNLIVPHEDAASFVEAVVTAHKQNAKEQKAKKLGKLENVFAKEYDDAGNETGNLIIKCKVSNRVAKKTGQLWDRKPVLLDAKLNPMNDIVGAGSLIRVSCEVYFWSSASLGFGCSLQPMAVQVFDLKSPSGAGADMDFGFEVGDGFTSEGVTDEPTKVLPTESEDEDLF